MSSHTHTHTFAPARVDLDRLEARLLPQHAVLQRARHLRTTLTRHEPPARRTPFPVRSAPLYTCTHTHTHTHTHTQMRARAPCTHAHTRRRAHSLTHSRRVGIGTTWCGGCSPMPRASVTCTPASVAGHSAASKPATTAGKRARAHHAAATNMRRHQADVCT